MCSPHTTVKQGKSITVVKQTTHNNHESQNTTFIIKNKTKQLLYSWTTWAGSELGYEAP